MLKHKEIVMQLFKLMFPIGLDERESEGLWIVFYVF